MFSDHRGGQSGTLDVFLKLVTYCPTFSKFKGFPVEKITLYRYRFRNNDLPLRIYVTGEVIEREKNLGSLVRRELSNSDF